MFVFVAQIGDVEIITRLYLDGKAAIRIGDGLAKCLIDINDSTCYRIAFRINDLAMYGSAVVGSEYCRSRHGERCSHQNSRCTWLDMFNYNIFHCLIFFLSIYSTFDDIFKQEVALTSNPRY